MKIICWNVNGIRAWYKKENTLDWVLKQKPDFFCLQETKARPDQLTEDLLEPAGYVSFFDWSKEKKGYSGTVIYVKKEYEEAITFTGSKVGSPKLDKEGRLVEVHLGDFVLINCYFPNGGGGPVRLKYKFEYYEAFLKKIEKYKKEGKKVVFCGDVNTAHKEIDLARPKENEKNTGFLPEERAWLDKVISKGWIDTFRFKNKNKKDAYSWWDMKTRARDRNVGWRIDYFFVSKDLEKDIQKAKIHSDVYGSDHCPISLELKGWYKFYLSK
ncbi:exodeoxyribonuclease III [Candidatus Pacebacteria bacterium]|nr:exodeoxyribonuclease III [Candidatus Paceibacterota bacterium]